MHCHSRHVFSYSIRNFTILFPSVSHKEEEEGHKSLRIWGHTGTAFLHSTMRNINCEASREATGLPQNSVLTPGHSPSCHRFLWEKILIPRLHPSLLHSASVVLILIWLPKHPCVIIHVFFLALISSLLPNTFTNPPQTSPPQPFSQASFQ